MARKPIHPTASPASSRLAPSASPQRVADVSGISDGEPAVDPIAAQVGELRELAQSLMSAVEEVRAQNVRNEMLRSAVEDVKADVRAASRAMIASPGPAAPATDEPRMLSGKCGPCQCVADGCCCFDIKVSQVRAAKPQIEPADMGDVGPFINALEVQMYFTVDGTGFLWPGLASTMDLRADGAPGGPGPWVVIERVVKRVCLPKGTSQTFDFLVTCREEDEGIERPLGMKDEVGEGRGTITLDCCVEKIFPAMPVEVYLIHGGEGRGMVQAMFYAERVCC